MVYYKIILHNEIIGVSKRTLTWGENIHRVVICDINDAEYVQDEITEKLYHTSWMKRPPSIAPQPIEANIIIIDAVEYDELYEQLKEDEPIPYIPPAPTPEPEPEPEPVEPPETPMTIQQMRDKIIEQGQMIDMLTECLLEVSELIYEE